MASTKWDVLKLDWLRRVTAEENWQRSVDWYPWEIISSTKSTENRLATLFDEFGDSFVDDADEKSLKHALNETQAWVSLISCILEGHKILYFNLTDPRGRRCF